MSKVRMEEAELEIIAIFERRSKEETMGHILEAMEFVDKDDTEIVDLMKASAAKLKEMSDEDYASYDFKRYLFEEDPDEL